MELKKLDISFVRYMDDYEVFLVEDNKEEIISMFVKILNKYGLSINFEKLEVINFPFYLVDNLDRIIENYSKSKNEDIDLINLFNTFFKLEKKGNKGAIRYLIKSLDKKLITPNNNRLFISYIINIMINDERALIKCCSL